MVLLTHSTQYFPSPPIKPENIRTELIACSYTARRLPSLLTFSPFSLSCVHLQLPPIAKLFWQQYSNNENSSQKYTVKLMSHTRITSIIEVCIQAILQSTSKLNFSTWTTKVIILKLRISHTAQKIKPLNSVSAGHSSQVHRLPHPQQRLAPTAMQELTVQSDWPQ